MKNNFYEQELETLKLLKRDFDNFYINADVDFESETLLRGLASLTGRIRAEMAETENEIAKNFVQRVAPDLLLPLPARSLVEIVPAPTDNLEREIGDSAILTYKIQNQKAFVWRVVGKHKLKPTQKIISVKAVEDSGGFDCLEFETSGDGPWIIYIDGSWNLWHLMLEHAKPYIVAKPQNPWELCRDFFCFEEKFKFIYMENLPKVLRFAKKLPRDIFNNISARSFKLNVLPIENSFEQNLEPVILSENSFEAKVSANEDRQVILHLKDVQPAVDFRFAFGKISFANLPENAEMLSVCAQVCDGSSAVLEKGNSLQTKDSSLQMCEVFSVTDSSLFLPPKNSEWNILALLQRNYLQFFECDALKNALEMQLLNEQGKRNYLVHSIREVSLENTSAVYKNYLLPKTIVKIIMIVDFVEIGILHAFGEMLFYLFKKIFICNMLVGIVLRVEPFGVELKWG